MLAFSDYVVHWGFDSGIARTTNVGSDVALLALDPIEDQFTVASLCNIQEDLSPGLSRIGGQADQLRLDIEKYAIGSVDRFNSVLKKYQKLPFENASEWIKPASHNQHINHNQSSAFLERSFSSPSDSDVATGGVHPIGSIVYFTLDTTR